MLDPHRYRRLPGSSAVPLRTAGIYAEQDQERQEK
jgi:hypothetical protein